LGLIMVGVDGGVVGFEGGGGGGWGGRG